MNSISRNLGKTVAISALALLLFVAFSTPSLKAQNFDFERLERNIQKYTVILKVKVELSFGMQNNESEQRLLGTIVSEDGLIVFDGSFISDHNPLSPMSSFAFRSRPTQIEVSMMDETKYDAEYLGVDRTTHFAFARIEAPEGTKFSPVKFSTNQRFRIGQWLAAFILLPDFVKPPIAADVAMISTKVVRPEEFTLIVGFSTLERGSVLYDEQLRPVGLLGALENPTNGSMDQIGMLDSFGEFDFPLLGVITAEKMEKLITNPPEKGKVDRAWLGITLQALTPDIASFLGVDVPGGIIINEIVPDSPAEDAGLEVGDVIYAIDGQPVDVDREEELPVFQNRISNMGSGAEVTFSVLRPTDTKVDTLQTLTHLRAAPLAASDAPEFEDEDLEFKARDLVFTDYMVYNVEQGSLTGVVVSELSQGGLATIGGLELGDVIQRVDGHEISSVEDLKAAMEDIKAQNPGEIVFFIWRFNKTLFLNIKTS